MIANGAQKFLLLAQKERQLAEAKARLARIGATAEERPPPPPPPMTPRSARSMIQHTAQPPFGEAPPPSAFETQSSLHQQRLMQLTTRLDSVEASDAAARRAVATALRCAVGSALRHARSMAVGRRWRHWALATSTARVTRTESARAAESAALEQRARHAEAELHKARLAAQTSTRAAQAASTAASQARGEAELQHDALDELRAELQAARQGRAVAEADAAEAEAKAAAAVSKAEAAEAARALMSKALVAENVELAAALRGSDEADSGDAEVAVLSAAPASDANVVAAAAAAADHVAARRSALRNQQLADQRRAALRLRGMLRFAARADRRARRQSGVCGAAFVRWASAVRVATDSMCWLHGSTAVAVRAAALGEQEQEQQHQEEEKEVKGGESLRAEQQRRRQLRRGARRAIGVTVLGAAFCRMGARQRWARQVLMRHALRHLALHSNIASALQRGASSAAAREAAAELSSAEAAAAAAAARAALGRAALRRWLRCIGLQGTAAVVRAFGRWRDGLLAEEIAMQAMELSSGRTMARCLKAIWRRRAGVAFARWRAVLASSAGVGLLIELRAQLESTTLRRLARARARGTAASSLLHWARVTGVAAGVTARRRAAAAAQDALEAAKAVCKRAAVRVLMRCERTRARHAWQLWRRACSAVGTAALLELRGTVGRMALAQVLRRWALVPSGLPAAWRRWVGMSLPWLLSGCRDAATQCVTTRLLWRAPAGSTATGSEATMGDGEANGAGAFVAGDRVVHARPREPSEHELQLEEHKRVAQARALEAAHALQAELEVSACACHCRGNAHLTACLPPFCLCARCSAAHAACARRGRS